MTDTAPDLKPCPFCGEKPEAKADHTTEQCHAVPCSTCGFWLSDDDAEWSCITAWNTRAMAPQ